VPLILQNDYFFYKTFHNFLLSSILPSKYKKSKIKTNGFPPKSTISEYRCGLTPRKYLYLDV
jgi:hypothetical protein